MLANKPEGPHWYCGNDSSAIENKIDYLLSISDREWEDIVKKSPLRMEHDPGNKKLKELVKKRLILKNLI